MVVISDSSGLVLIRRKIRSCSSFARAPCPVTLQGASLGGGHSSTRHAPPARSRSAQLPPAAAPRLLSRLRSHWLPYLDLASDWLSAVARRPPRRLPALNIDMTLWPAAVMCR